MNKRLWILGASDPEMQAIESILTEAGEDFRYALDYEGKRVHAGNAYSAVSHTGGTEIVQIGAKGHCIRKSGAKKGKRYNYYFHQGKNGHERSRTFQGIADAMADQWGSL